jgi:hypothetical protein
MVPKRAEELLDGGSLYWVIRGSVMCRQQLIGVRRFVDKDGIGRCRLVLKPKVVLVAPRPSPKDAPPDLDRAAPRAADMPEPLRRELRDLGLL